MVIDYCVLLKLRKTIIQVKFILTTKPSPLQRDLVNGNSSVQNPEALSIFGQADCNNIINPDINDLTPAIDGKFIPAESDQVADFSTNTIA
jgi:hypothetical protein